MEPKVQVGDYVLSEQQVTAMRFAITLFRDECASEEGKKDLGPIADTYNMLLSEVLQKMLSGLISMEPCNPICKERCDGCRYEPNSSYRPPVSVDRPFGLGGMTREEYRKWRQEVNG